MYSPDRVRRHDRDNAWVDELLKEWKVADNVSFALNRVFSSSLYWPLDPYRTILHILRRKERDQDLILGSGPVNQHRDALDLRGHTIKFAKFSPLTLSGQPYLSLLLSTAAVRRGLDIVSEFRGLTGNLPAEVSSNNSNAHYVETLHINSCMTGAVRCLRPHDHAVVVEASFEGEDMDACLMLFIRRILQEGTEAEESHRILNVHIDVLMREPNCTKNRDAVEKKKPFTFVPSEIKSSKRQSILSSMKAAIVDGGSIFLHCYYFTAHTIPTFKDASHHLSQRTSGYILLKRKYNFTFVNRKTGAVKCFSDNPYESIALCLFPSSSDSQLVRRHFLKHCEKGGSDTALMKSFVLNFVHDQSVRFVQFLDAGELALAAECVISLIAHSAVDSHVMPQSGMRFSSLSVGPPGYVRMVRDCVQNVEGVIEYLLREIKSIARLSLRQERRLWNDEASKIVSQLEHRMSTLSPALEELRYLLSCMWTDISSSEKDVVQNFVLSELRIVVNVSMQRSQSISVILRAQRHATVSDAGSIEFIGNPPLVAINNHWLNALSIPLCRINSALAALECSLAGDILFELLQIDADESMSLFRDSLGQKGSSNSSGNSDSVNAEHPRKYYFMDYRPAKVTDLIGALLKIVEVKDIGLMEEWSPFDVKSFSYRQIIKQRGHDDVVPVLGSAHSRVRFRPNNEPLHEDAETYVLDTEAEEMGLIMNSEETKKSFGTTLKKSNPTQMYPGRFASRFMRVFASLAVSWRGRLGAIDAISSLMDEVYQYDSPRGIAEDATRTRYLTGTRVVSALNEGFRSIAFSPDRANVYESLCRCIYKYSSKLNLWRHSNDDILSRYPLLVSSLRKAPDIQSPHLTGPHQHGYYKLTLEAQSDVRTASKLFSDVTVQGGVYGPIELLKCLSNWRQLYLSSWLLPPMLTRGSYQIKGDGVVLETYCGVAGETALSWSSPKMSLTEAKARDRKHGDPADRPACTGDADLWSAEPEGKVFLDIVLKVTKNRRQSVDIARLLFADEVVKLIDDLAAHRRWIAYEMSAQSCVEGQAESPAILGDAVKVFPLSKTSSKTHVGSNGVPSWATDAFMTALRVRGEAVAECAVLVGQDVDDGAYASVDANVSPKGARMKQSTAAAKQFETVSPLESCPVAFPALIDTFKELCSTSKVSSGSNEEVIDIDQPDKWWGGGEGWRGTDSDTAHEKDPTMRDSHRNSVFSSASQKIQSVIAMREGLPRVYIPCQLRFSLLCYSAAERFDEQTHDDDEMQGSVSAVTNGSAGNAPASKLSNVRSIFKKAAKKASLLSNISDTPQGLVLGGGKLISRLIASTVWLSADAAGAVWSCLPANTASPSKRAQLVKAVINAESKFKLLDAKSFCTQLGKTDYVRAYKFAGISAALSPNPEAVKIYFPDSVRMVESLAFRTRSLTDTLIMLRNLLDRPRSGQGDCLGLTDIEALTTTLVLHVSLSTRLLVSSPQCVHYMGGSYCILALIYKLETLLQLGKFDLSSGMRSGFAMLGDEGTPWRLPTPVLDQETILEMREKRVKFDGTTGVRRAIAAGGETVQQLSDIILSLEGFCSLLSSALAEDVHNCCCESMSAHILRESIAGERPEPVSTDILARRMDNQNKKYGTKKVIFADNEKPASSRSPVETSETDPQKPEAETDSTAFLNAIQDSLLLPSEKNAQRNDGHIDIDHDSEQSILHNRKRRPAPNRDYGPDAVTMLDQLRFMYEKEVAKPTHSSHLA